MNDNKFPFDQVCSDVTKTATKIPVGEYLSVGKYKIFDQGKDFIGGFRDEKEGIVTNFPYILFGDHTRIIKYIDEPCFIGADGVKLLKVINSRYIPKYVYYAMKAQPIETKGYARHFKFLKEQFYPCIPINTQQKIVSNLDNMEQGIHIQQEQLKALDELIQSRFTEMFGDKKFERKAIKFVVSDAIQTTKKVFLQEELIKYVDISCVNNRQHLITTMTEYKVKNAPSRAQQHIQYNDILVSTVRPNLKNIAINKYNNNDMVASSGFCVLRPVNCVPEYLMYNVLSDLFTLKMMELTTGASYPAIRDKDVLNYMIPIPPLSLQNQFAEFVHRVEKAKEIVNARLTHLETLYKSLMQEYFG